MLIELINHLGNTILINSRNYNIEIDTNEPRILFKNGGPSMLSAGYYGTGKYKSIEDLKRDYMKIKEAYIKDEKIVYGIGLDCEEEEKHSFSTSSISYEDK